MLCQFLLYSKVTQSHTHIHSFSHIIFHHVSCQETGYSSLCCTAGPRCLSILNVIVCIYEPQTLRLPPSPSSLATTSLLSIHICGSVSVLWIGSFTPYFRFHIAVISYIICPSLSDLLSMRISSCIHVAANGMLSFFFVAKYPLYIQVQHFLHPSQYLVS